MHRARTVVGQLRPLLSVGYNHVTPGSIQRPIQGANQWLSKLIARNYASAHVAEPFLNGSTSVYIEEMYNAWLADPTSVHKVSTNVSNDV